jgi:hypothetical protein
MRTKTLLITAALSAAGLVGASAQVFSVNAVGYVNLTIPPNGYAIISNPLNGNPDNRCNTILPLPQDGSYDGSAIYRFNPSNQQYRDTIQFLSGLGWLSAEDPDPTINPGEGFFLQNSAGQALNITMVGEVPSGTQVNPLPGPNQYSIRSSIVPRGGRLGFIGQAGTLEFPAEDGDALYIFNSTTQQYDDTWQFLSGLGWLSASDPNTDGPLINPGNGFFVQKGSTAANTSWTQTFSVN